MRGVTLELARPERPRRSPAGSRPRPRFPRRWSTASCRRPSPRTSSGCRAHRPPGPVAGDARAVPPVGGRGPFRRRPAPRPRRGGVQLVEDVTPFELMKLRCSTAPTPRSPTSATSPGTRRSPTPSTTPPSPASSATSGAPRSSRRWRRHRARIRRLRRRALLALRQPGDPPPHLADRDGRLAEAAAAHPRHHRRRRAAGAPLPRPRARRRRLDALRRWQRRRGPRRSTSATRWPPA